MIRLDGIRRRIGACALALAVAGCARQQAAADEPPVNPAAGRYELSESGGAFGMMMKDREDAPKTYCLMQHERAGFAHKLVKARFGLHPSCTSSIAPREGNKVAGEIKCPADPKLAQGSSRFVYTGKHSADSVEANVRIEFDAVLRTDKMSAEEARQMKAGIAAMKHIQMNIAAKRIGSCY